MSQMALECHRPLTSPPGDQACRQTGLLARQRRAVRRLSSLLPSHEAIRSIESYHAPLKWIACLLSGMCETGGFAHSLHGRIYGAPNKKHPPTPRRPSALQSLIASQKCDAIKIYCKFTADGHVSGRGQLPV